VRILVRFLIPLALAAAVVVAAVTAPGSHVHAKQTPTRALQVHR
jgi:hypothetical protein